MPRDAEAFHTCHFDDVFDAELTRIGQIRLAKQARYGEPASGRDLFGLALSGGGIRSAAFGLGVLQSFASQGVLKRFDYLSTVSGGGYIGSALTWLTSTVWAGEQAAAGPGSPDGSPSARPRAGTDKADHPLGRTGAGAKTGEVNDRIDHIRGFGNYLKPAPELWAGSAVALVLQNMVCVVLLWFGPLVLALLALDLAAKGAVLLSSRLALGPSADPLRSLGELNAHLELYWIVAAIVGVLALLRVSWVPGRFDHHFQESAASSATPPADDYRSRLARQASLGFWLALGVAFAILAVLPQLSKAAFAISGLSITAGAGATLTSLVGWLATRPMAKELILRLGVVLLAVGVLVLAASLPEQVAELLRRSAGLEPATARWLVLLLALAAALAAVVASFRAKLNHVSPHRLYRDRLMETFLPDPPRGKGIDLPGGGTWRPATRADREPLAEMCDPQSLAPYHLINTNIILVGSKVSVVRNRGGESFLLSPLWSGCDRTGWRRTDRLFNDREVQLQLATAMAISGAAANPNTGASGRGLSRGAVVSRLMMLFNLRLAYWLPNPNEDHRLKDVWERRLRWLRWLSRVSPEDNRARFAYPGAAALLGLTHNEETGHVELSDGGHFENLGVYELIRRRLPLIVVSDAGADPGLAFDDLANLIERVRVDFGVAIEFAWPDFALTGVQPRSARTCRVGAGEVATAERGWALARVSYPALPPPRSRLAALTEAVAGRADFRVREEAFEGCLVYIKPTPPAAPQADIMAYMAGHPVFPHETTADQFFDEAQFEAYRELGYQTTKDFIEHQQKLAGDKIRPTPARPGSSGPGVLVEELLAA